MRCHYDVLGVQRDADGDTIKKAYRKMALIWHPDKNPDRQEECTREFAIIQQAYDILADAHDRAWYDRHRDAILRGGIDENYKDDAVNLFPFFNTSCYSGFGDDERSFYSVFGNLFARIGQEDLDFIEIDEQTDEMFPPFGNADSDFDEVVGVFYGVWQSYNTSRSYVWVDKYDITQAPNRPTLRAMEKENKKLRDNARKERSELVRELVSFVRKRDRRVIANRKRLQTLKEQQKLKAEQHRKQQIRLKNQALAEASSVWDHSEHHEAELKNIEANLAAEFGGSGGEASSNNEDKDEVNENLYCVVCEKTFRTSRQRANHEQTRKHRDALAELKQHLTEEEFELMEQAANLHKHTHTNQQQQQNTNKNKRKKNKKNKQFAHLLAENSDSDGEEENEPKIDNLDQNESIKPAIDDDDIDGLIEETSEKMDSLNIEEKEETVNSSAFVGLKSTSPDKTNSSALKKNKTKLSDDEVDPNAVRSVCDKCKESFPSKTKLFAHLKQTGHATLLTAPQAKTGAAKAAMGDDYEPKPQTKKKARRAAKK